MEVTKMAIIKHKNGTIKKVKINKDIIEELLESSKDKKAVEEVLISRIIITKTEEEIGKLKELCTKYKIDVAPLDRKFRKHRIWIREDNIKDAFKKLIILKSYFKD